MAYTSSKSAVSCIRKLCETSVLLRTSDLFHIYMPSLRVVWEFRTRCGYIKLPDHGTEKFCIIFSRKLRIAVNTRAFATMTTSTSHEASRAESKLSNIVRRLPTHTLNHKLCLIVSIGLFLRRKSLNTINKRDATSVDKCVFSSSACKVRSSTNYSTDGVNRLNGLTVSGDTTSHPLTSRTDLIKYLQVTIRTAVQQRTQFLYFKKCFISSGIKWNASPKLISSCLPCKVTQCSIFIPLTKLIDIICILQSGAYCLKTSLKTLRQRQSRPT